MNTIKLPFSSVLLIFSLAIFIGLPNDAQGSIVSYEGTGAALGLSATAEFQLMNNGNSLYIELTNTSSNWYMNGSEQVLSSINFSMPTAIVGGRAGMGASSDAVRRDVGNGWAAELYHGDLNDEYAFSNNGLQNSTSTNAILNGVDAYFLRSIRNSVTSHTQGDKSDLYQFGGNGNGAGGMGFGLVNGNRAFGKQMFLRNKLKIYINLRHSLSDLSFLDNGSYVEFGSDYAYIAGRASVPEPGSMLVWSSLLGVCVLSTRRHKR